MHATLIAVPPEITDILRHAFFPCDVNLFFTIARA